MPYITREDGEHFVIPSYRDVLTAKQKTGLKKEILALSQNYGEFITMQRKGADQYEVAFSPDTGYLLGESIWHYFKRPLDMIYCEAIPNTTEAILVIVKSGSVYLDGSFHIDSIPEELVIFLTQENNFEIFVHGDVPISQTPEAGKFSFEAAAVKTYTVLDKPVFPTLPLLKIYQLQLVDQVLRAHGIGVFPIKSVLLLCVIVGLAWMGYSYVSTHRPEIIQFRAPPPPPNEYLAFNKRMMSPRPEELIAVLIKEIGVLGTLKNKGWNVTRIDFAEGSLTATVMSAGAPTKVLYQWADANNYQVSLSRSNYTLSTDVKVPNRGVPTDIYPIQRLVSAFVDRLQTVYPGNTFSISDAGRSSSAVFRVQTITIKVDKTTPVVMALIAKQFEGLPFVLGNISLTVAEGGTLFSGTIKVDIVGN